jgi:hypothetical protein
VYHGVSYLDDCTYQSAQIYLAGFGDYGCGLCRTYDAIVTVLPEVPCAPEVVIGLSFDSSQTLAWSMFDPCGTYDVIRGVLPGPSEQLGEVNLGHVQCLANDVANVLTDDYKNRIAVSEDPPLGGVFFYLVRSIGFNYGSDVYGYSSSGAPERPSAGDCAP